MAAIRVDRIVADLWFDGSIIPAEARTMKLEKIMPTFDKSERHDIEISASPEAVYDSVWKLDLTESRLASVLFRIRGLPREARTLRGLIDLGFNLLEDDPPREILLGLIAKFWTARPDLLEHDSESFQAFDSPGYGKAAWNFFVEPRSNGRTRLTTETRVRSTDPRSRRLFSVYWFVVRLGSGWIRRIMLRLIKRHAEAQGA